MRDIENRLEEVTNLCNYRLWHMADVKINQIYEEFINDTVKMNENQEEWMFCLIDRISIALYC